jgi:peptidoglycan-associated lipoprotein
MKTIWGLAISGITFLGCAHAPPTATTETTSAPATASAQRQAEAPPPKPTPTADADLDSLLHGQVVNFGFDEAQLTPESEQRLQRLSEAMRSHPGVKLAVAGNCDELGTEEYNLALGQKRAAVAKQYLTSLGIDANRVSTVSYGKERPLNRGHDEQARAENRRDDLSLTER